MFRLSYLNDDVIYSRKHQVLKRNILFLVCKESCFSPQASILTPQSEIKGCGTSFKMDDPNNLCYFNFTLICQCCMSLERYLNNLNPSSSGVASSITAA